MGRSCLVPKCKSGYNSKKNKISIFKVPDKIEMLNKWEAAIPGINKLKSTQSICEKHFEEKFIIRKYIKHDANGKIIAEVPFQRPRLHPAALPTIFNNNTNQTPLLSQDSNQKMDINVNCAETTFAKDREKCHIRITDNICVYPSRRDEPSNLIEHSYSARTITPDIPVEKRHFNLVSEVSYDDAPSQIKEEIYFEESPLVEPDLPLPMSPSSRGWDFSTVKINERIDDRVACIVDDGRYTAEIPHSWSVSELSRGPEQKILFSHARAITRNGETTPIILKCVILQSDGVMRYHVYGRPVNVAEGQHLKVLEKTSDLPRVLERFERANLCGGIGPVDVFQLQADQVFQDYFEQWHHNSCSLLSRTRRCKSCAHLRKIQLQREARSRKRKTPCRIRSSLNPVEEKKLAAIRKRNECLRRAKNRAKLRVNLLLESLKEK